MTVRPDHGPDTGSGSPSTGPNEPIINHFGRNRGVYFLSRQRSEREGNLLCAKLDHREPLILEWMLD
jgi:hypothetical protein